MRTNFKIKTFSGNFKKKILAKNKCEPPQNAWSGLKKLNLQQSVRRKKTVSERFVKCNRPKAVFQTCVGISFP